MVWKNPFYHELDALEEEGGIFSTTFESAQSFVNFVVLRPETLPDDCRLKPLTIRKETVSMRSSARFEIIGKNRRFRVKQEI
jgi:hypothetical protein